MSGAQALILAGGGAFAAYEVGVLKALAGGRSPATGYRPLEAAFFFGTSAGAFNAAMLAAEAGADLLPSVLALEHAWLDEIAERPGGGNGVFRWRAEPGRLLDPAFWARQKPLRLLSELAEDGSFFARDLASRAAAFARSSGPLERRAIELIDLTALVSTAPFLELLRRIVPFERLRLSPRALRIAATNWETGELRIFTNQHLGYELGPRIIAASSAIPGLFPPVTVGADTYVDGGLLMNTPLVPAIACGATTMHAVYLDPDVSNIPLADLQTTLATLQRGFIIALAAVFNRDIERAAEINAGLDALEGRGGAGTADLVRAAGAIALRGDTAAPFARLTIHRYHPLGELGGPLGVLDFRRRKLEELIERGFAEARNHDCEESGCVLASRPSSAPGDRDGKEI